MIRIREAIIVEGRYDVNKLRQLVDTVIIETKGFGIFNNKENLNLIRKIADSRGILILTDSDGAGFVIRNYLKGAIPKDKVKHAYIPDILGKEKRKKQGSKAGTLGVEGIPNDIILNALKNAGANFENTAIQGSNHKLSKADLFALKLSGTPGSDERRKKLLEELNLPKEMSANALLEFINAIEDYESILTIIKRLD